MPRPAPSRPSSTTDTAWGAGTARAAADEERGEREQVAERHPLHGGEPRAELALQRWEGHRDNARVELAHERAEAHRGDREPRGERVLADNRGSGRLAQQCGHQYSLILNLLQNYY